MITNKKLLRMIAELDNTLDVQGEALEQLAVTLNDVVATMDLMADEIIALKSKISSCKAPSKKVKVKVKAAPGRPKKVAVKTPKKTAAKKKV